MPTLPTNPHYIGDSGHVNDHNTIVSALAQMKLLGIYQAQKTDTFNTSAGTWVDVTGLSYTITPKLATNKILVVMSVMGSATVNGSMFLRLIRDTTAIGVGNAAGSRTRATSAADTNGGDWASSGVMLWIDEPNTTSSTTYKVQAHSGDSGGNARINYGGSDADNVYSGRYVSTLTLVEIAV